MYKILIFHIIISIIIEIIYILKSENKKKFFTILIPLCLPFAGYLIILLFYISDRKTYDYEFTEEYESRRLIFTDELTDYEEDVTSLEDAIYLSSDKEKQKQFLKFLKINNYYRNGALLKQAVKDSDVELSHYASVALTDAESNLNINIRKKAKIYQNNKSVISAKEYAKALCEYLNSNLSNTYYEKKYNFRLIEVLKYILQNERTKETYDMIINILMRQDRLEECNKYINEYFENFKCEDSYLKKLEFLYKKRDMKQFYIMLNSLRNSTIILSNKGLNIIRFWLGEERKNEF